MKVNKLFVALFSFLVLSLVGTVTALADEGGDIPPIQPTCHFDVSLGEDGQGGNVFVNATVEHGVAWDYAIIKFGAGEGEYGFQLDGNGNGTSGPKGHYYAPGQTYHISMGSLSGASYDCAMDFEIVVDEHGKSSVHVISGPDNSLQVCSWPLPVGMPVGASLTVEYWDGVNNLWASTGYTAEAKSDGVYVLFYNRHPDHWGYRIRSTDTEWYLPFVYGGHENPADLWDRTKKCQDKPGLGIM
jgi:hypothetical protein